MDEDKVAKKARNLEAAEELGKFTWKQVRHHITGRPITEGYIHFTKLKLDVSITDKEYVATVKGVQTTYPVATQEQMKKAYDGDASIAKYIQAPKGYEAPWERK